MSIVSSSSSIATIKIKASPPTKSSNCYSLRPSTIVIRSSKADGPLRRPSLSPPPPPPSIIKPTIVSSPSLSPPKPKPEEEQVVVGVSLEYQRKMAKEMQDYFKKKKAEESNQGPAFGFVPKNEISNGRIRTSPEQRLKRPKMGEPTQRENLLITTEVMTTVKTARKQTVKPLKENNIADLECSDDRLL